MSLLSAVIADIKRNLFSEVVGYQPVYVKTRRGVYMTRKPIIRVMDNKTIAKLFLQGLMGFIMVYAFLVLLIGSMPVHQ